MTEKPKPQSAEREHELAADPTITKPLKPKKGKREELKSKPLTHSLGDLLREKGFVD